MAQPRVLVLRLGEKDLQFFPLIFLTPFGPVTAPWQNSVVVKFAGDEIVVVVLAAADAAVVCHVSPGCHV